MWALIEKVNAEFEKRFGQHPEFHSQAPGRINILGEHTDYTGGVSLPAAVDRWTVAAWRRTNDDKLKIYSCNIDEEWHTTWSELESSIDADWKKYVAGCMVLFKDSISKFRGLELVLLGNVPLGKGMSSSASVELAVLNGLNRIFDNPLNLLQLSLMAQQVEHRFLKVKSGLLDQFACQFGMTGGALLIDFATLQTKPAPGGPDMKNYSWVLADSLVKRELASSKYSERVSEYESILQTARTAGFQSLRDLKSEQVPQLFLKGPDNLLRRARHIVSENERTFKAVERLKEGDAAGLGRLLTETHRSLALDYEVSHPNLDFMVETAGSMDGVKGGRMMGGGFGGCALFLVANENVDQFSGDLTKAYEKFCGQKTDPRAVQFVAGASAWAGDEP